MRKGRIERKSDQQVQLEEEHKEEEKKEKETEEKLQNGKEERTE